MIGKILRRALREEEMRKAEQARPCVGSRNRLRATASVAS